MSDYRDNKPLQQDNYKKEQMLLDYLDSIGFKYEKFIDTNEDLQGLDIVINGIKYDVKACCSDSKLLTLFRRNSLGEWYCPLFDHPDVKYYLYARKRKNNPGYTVIIIEKQEIVEFLINYANQLPCSNLNRFVHLLGRKNTGYVPQFTVDISELWKCKSKYFFEDGAESFPEMYGDGKLTISRNLH